LLAASFGVVCRMCECLNVTGRLITYSEIYLRTFKLGFTKRLSYGTSPKLQMSDHRSAVATAAWDCREGSKLRRQARYRWQSRTPSENLQLIFMITPSEQPPREAPLPNKMSIFVFEHFKPRSVTFFCFACTSLYHCDLSDTSHHRPEMSMYNRRFN